MAVHRIDIEEFIGRSAGNAILDVRSPGEYGHAHMPEATSFPIFTDEQRAIIGTAYKQKGREAAVAEGLEFFSKTVTGIQPAAVRLSLGNGSTSQPAFFIYCWRGGMRSDAIAWTLGLYGYKVYVLAGGYKAFRRWVLQQFEKEYNFKLLGGFTGSGKTWLLNELRSMGQEVADLENIANHRGSAFGSLGRPAQPSQEMFENRLALCLWNAAQTGKPIWVEDESRHIGRIHIPKTVWENMRKSPLYFLDIPFEKRRQYILSEYGGFERESLTGCVQKIAKRLGPVETKTAINLLEDGHMEGAFDILLKYYDKLYSHSLETHAKSGSSLHKITASGVDKRNVNLLI